MLTLLTDNILFSYILMFSFLVRLFAVFLNTWRIVINNYNPNQIYESQKFRIKSSFILNDYWQMFNQIKQNWNDKKFQKIQKQNCLLNQSNGS